MPCLRHTPRITSELPRLFWHGEGLSLKLSCCRKRPSTRRDTSYPGAPAEYLNRCRKYLIYDTAERPPCRPRIGQTMSRMIWYGVGLRFKLLYTRNGPVLDEICRILLHQQHNQTGVVNKRRKSLIYETGVASTLLTTPRNVHDTDSGSARRCHGCFGMV